MSTPEPICHTLFTDGLMRPVFEDGRRRQEVIDDGEPVNGLWFIPCEEAELPLIVEGKS